LTNARRPVEFRVVSRRIADCGSFGGRLQWHVAFGNLARSRNHGRAREVTPNFTNTRRIRVQTVLDVVDGRTADIPTEVIHSAELLLRTVAAELIGRIIFSADLTIQTILITSLNTHDGLTEPPSKFTITLIYNDYYDVRPWLEDV
jgi:hypothetical protein